MTERKLSVVIVATDNEQCALLQALVEGTSVARSVDACANFPVAGDDLVTRSVRAANPDVILVDIPVDDSQLAQRAIERLLREVPLSAIFAIGSLSQQEVVVNAMRAGAREFIARPTTTTALLDAFVRLIADLTRTILDYNRTLTTILAICDLIKHGGSGVEAAVEAYARAMKEDVIEYRRLRDCGPDALTESELAEQKRNLLLLNGPSV